MVGKLCVDGALSRTQVRRNAKGPDLKQVALTGKQVATCLWSSTLLPTANIYWVNKMWHEEINEALTHGFQCAVQIIDNKTKTYDILLGFAGFLNTLPHHDALIAMGMFFRALGVHVK